MPHTQLKTHVRSNCHDDIPDPGGIVKVTIHLSYPRRRPPDVCSPVYAAQIQEHEDFPVGYETVLGYFERTNPEAFSLLYDPKEDLLEDEKWIECRCMTAGLLILNRGDIKAFPVEMLSRRLG